MAHLLKDTFNRIINLEGIDDRLASAAHRYIVQYELRDTNPLAFNSSYLGVHKCLFCNSDRENFISLFVTGNPPHGTDENEIRAATTDIVRAVNGKNRVMADPFNLFITYLLHCILTSRNIKSPKVRHDAAVYVLKFLQYKFFTSLVNHYFPHKPSESIMQAMVENLSNKYDIKVYGTWSKVLEVRAEQTITPASIHYRTLMNYDNDNAILYILTDTQTRVRSQVGNVTAAFYATKEQEDTIRSYSTLGTNSEGETGLVDYGNSLDTAILNIYNDCMNITKFLDQRIMYIVNSQFKNIHPTVFKNFLIAFSEYAVKATRAGKARDVKRINGEEILIGPEILVNSIVQQCYRFCINNHIDIKRPIAVLKAIKDVFSSSRISDEKILQIRKSMEYLVLELQSNRREIILSGLRISFILYILLLSFKYSRE